MIERKIIKEFVLNMGITPELKGYEYIIDAVEKLIAAPNTKLIKLYTDIAKSHNATASSVERAIKHAINTVFKEYDGIKSAEKIFHCRIVSDRLTNSKFLALCAENLKHNDSLNFRRSNNVHMQWLW